jgi:hypothetical protein
MISDLRKETGQNYASWCPSDMFVGLVSPHVFFGLINLQETMVKLPPQLWKMLFRSFPNGNSSASMPCSGHMLPPSVSALGRSIVFPPRPSQAIHTRNRSNCLVFQLQPGKTGHDHIQVVLVLFVDLWANESSLCASFWLRLAHTAHTLHFCSVKARILQRVLLLFPAT